MRFSAILLAVALLAGVGSGAAAQERGGGDAPRDVGLVERTERRLAQLDVTVTGPAPAITELTRDDFELVVDSEFVSDFVVDRVCRLPEAERAEKDPEVAEPEPSTPAATDDAAYVSTRALPATLLFYFDQQQLTMYGRQQALDIARSLIPRLVAGGNRAMVVSNASELKTFADLTEDVDELLAAVDRVERDRKQWNPYAENEGQRIGEVMRELRNGNTEFAKSLARMHQKDEQFRTGAGLRRFATVVARLADLDPPKAVIYFADTMRANAGAHYSSFFTRAEAGLDQVLDAMAVDGIASRNPFDRVLDEAAAHGVRVYSVHAQGLVTDTSVSFTGAGRPVAATLAGNASRIRDAQDALGSLAQETGGQAFLRGVPTLEIAEKIAQDLECLYLVSFDATRFPEDETLRVLLRLKRQDMRAQVRGQLRLMSEQSRRRSRLLAAFSAPGTLRSEIEVLGRIVPSGFENGRYSALLQISVPGSALPSASWDIGASIVSGGRVRDESSERITMRSPNVPIVYETQVNFPPGKFEVMMVAHETTSDSIASGKLQGEWPDPDQANATVGPIAVLQPATAAFLRDGVLQTSGGLAIGERAPLRHDAETALIGIVCRGKRKVKKYRLHRTLVGASAAEFEPMDLEFEGQRCAQFRDLVPAGTMTEGTFVYEVRVHKGKDELAARDVEFLVLDAAAGTPAASVSPGRQPETAASDTMMGS